MFSVFIIYPLTCLVYLLTADWDIPRSSATWFCFRLYWFMSCFTMAAFIAGITDFTAISHGIINFSPLYCGRGKVYKYDVRHK